tara:strand:+ start:27918 stop:29792 length:1875 start_codon:yes stop_codon:yes gene_type:complete
MGLQSPRLTSTVSGNTVATAVTADDLEVDSGTLSIDADNNRVGMGVTDPDSTLEVFSATTQQKWSYDANSFATITVADASHTTIATGESGDLTLDAADDIILDSHVGKWRMMRNGTLTNLISATAADGSKMVFDNQVANAGYDFKCNDGGVGITALSIDAANAGAATFNNKVIATELDISGDADIDGTCEADAYTVNGTTLAEYIADTVGAMVGSNTETGITVSYDDTDNTLDFVVGTLNQDTSGTAAVATTVTCADESSDTTCFVGYVTAATGDLGLKTGSNLTFNSNTGTLSCTALEINNVTLAETIADTVGAMVSSNTETGITVTYQDADNTIDFAVAAPTSLGTITQDTVTFTSASADDPLVIIQNTTNDAAAPRLRFVKDKGAAGADADGCGEIEFYGDDDQEDNILFAKIRAEVADASNSEEGGRLMLGVATEDGEFQNGLVIEDGSEEDEIDVIIGNGINSVVTANGYSKALNGFLVPEGKSVHIETPLLTSADHTANGMTTILNASESFAIGDLVYVSGNGTVGKALANAVAKMPAIGLAVTAGNNGQPAVILLKGTFRDDSYNFTAGNRLYAHTDGTITATAPSGNNQVAQAVGVALNADVIMFSPDMTLVEITA